MRRLAALVLLLPSACAGPLAPPKMSFEEFYAQSAPLPSGVEAAHPGTYQQKTAQRLLQPDAPQLRAALESFVERARGVRGTVIQGSAMPEAQVNNWRQMNAMLDSFLHQAARQTAALDVVRTRTTLESELEQDARAYGDIPSELADAVLAHMDQLALRLAEIRTHQHPRSRSTAFAWPVEPVYITSVFGSRLHPILGTERDHQGLDLGAKAGQSVMASARGVVVRAGWAGGHGNQVVLQHEGNVTTRYSHLSRILVTVGEEVQQGDEVGEAGKTGLATGVHLHFELWRDGEPVDPLDEMGPTESGEEPTFASR